MGRHCLSNKTDVPPSGAKHKEWPITHVHFVKPRWEAIEATVPDHYGWGMDMVPLQKVENVHALRFGGVWQNGSLIARGLAHHCDLVEDDRCFRVVIQDICLPLQFTLICPVIVTLK